MPCRNGRRVRQRIMGMIFIATCPLNLGFVSHAPPIGRMPRRMLQCDRMSPAQRVTMQATDRSEEERGADTSNSQLQKKLARSYAEIERLSARVRELEAERAEEKMLPRPSQFSIRHARQKDAAAPYREASWWDPAEVQEWLGARPIGRIMTSFPEKNGTPRQGSVVPASKARLVIEFGNNPQHALEGLEAFSHVWLLFLFHDNRHDAPPKAKVRPPRLGGATKGVFATRSPHRPNPIGLSLCQLDSVCGRSVELSGVDLVDGTPILDMKPYIPAYDCPQSSECIRTPTWSTPEARARIRVHLAPTASADLSTIQQSAHRPRLAATWQEAVEGLRQVLAADPRSVYRRERCAGEVYPIYFDRLNAWCLFDDASVGGPSVSIQRLFLLEAGVRLPAVGRVRD